MRKAAEEYPPLRERKPRIADVLNAIFSRGGDPSSESIIVAVRKATGKELSAKLVRLYAIRWNGGLLQAKVVKPKVKVGLKNMPKE